MEINKPLFALALAVAVSLFFFVRLHEAKGDVILDDKGRNTCQQLTKLQEKAGMELDGIRMKGKSKSVRSEGLQELLTTLDSWYFRHCESDPNALS